MPCNAESPSAGTAVPGFIFCHSMRQPLRCARRQAASRACAPLSPETSTLTPGTAKSLRSEEHTSELQSLMRISYAVFCLKKKKQTQEIPRKQINTTQDIQYA